VRHFFDSIKSFAYWRYALFSGEAITKFLACLGTLFLFVQIADEFNIYKKDQYSQYGLIILIVISIIYVLTTRRPIRRVNYKVPKKDLTFTIMIGDIFKCSGETIISSSSTFDTDMATGLIASGSLQGQLAVRYFNGQTAEIDRQIEVSLANDSFVINEKRPGKKKEYAIGTVAQVAANGKNFYLVAMSHMNESGNAYSDAGILDDALERLWDHMTSRGEFGDIVMPLIGTGRGRVAIPRKKIIERIAQSFADASKDHVFSNKLIIVVRPEDASKFSLNLFQVRDYLGQSLNV
jgi:hypothetical protein